MSLFAENQYPEDGEAEAVDTTPNQRRYENASDGHAGLLTRPRIEVMPFDSAEQQLVTVSRDVTITVTCSPKHGIQHTLDFSDRLRARGFSVVPHIAARLVTDQRHISYICQRLRDQRYTDVFIIGGDQTLPAGPYNDALPVLSQFNVQAPEIRVGIGGYPEGHPTIQSRELLDALIEKQRFASVITTQICFDAFVIVEWVRSIRRAGITLPVLVGMPGVVDRRKLIELSARVGVGASMRYLRKNFGLVSMMFRQSTYSPESLYAKLTSITANDPDLKLAGIHLYSFNQIAATDQWLLDSNPNLKRTF